MPKRDLKQDFRAEDGTLYRRGKGVDVPASLAKDLGGSDSEEQDFESMSAEELQAEADQRGLKVKGTGANGNVLKADLVKALEKDSK